MCSNYYKFTNFYVSSIVIGGVAPGTPSAAMIMEGLETLVAPSHHTFLLTESAAAAHFNVLSFDTCLFKTSAQSSPSTSGATYLTTPSSFGGGPLGTQTLLHYNLSTSTSSSLSPTSLAESSTAAATTAASSASATSTNSSLSRHSNRLPAISVAPETQQQQQHHQQQQGSPIHHHNSPSIASAAVTISTNTNSGRNSASHLSLLNTTQHSPVACASVASGADSVDIKHSHIDAQPGDLNTPVTTSSDIPSFFGPSTVVEPPPITGKRKNL